MQTNVLSDKLIFGDVTEGGRKIGNSIAKPGIPC